MTKSHLLPSRAAKKATLDPSVIYSILDEALFCTISYSIDNMPFSIPTAFVREGNQIIIHGSVGSHFLRGIESGIPVCISVTLVDDLVVAKSAFSHSVNYRSVIIFSNAVKIESMEEKSENFRKLTEKIVPGSWEYLRPMTQNEVKKTMGLSFCIDEASAKIRTGMPMDEPEDLELPIWSGLIPIAPKRGVPVADDTSLNIPLPPHLSSLSNEAR